MEKYKGKCKGKCKGNYKEKYKEEYQGNIKEIKGNHKGIAERKISRKI